MAVISKDKGPYGPWVKVTRCIINNRMNVPLAGAFYGTLIVDDYVTQNAAFTTLYNIKYNNSKILFDNNNDNNGNSSSNKYISLYFHNSLYGVIITMSTVRM